MRRREFITLLSGAAAWPLAARAQKAEPVRRIGVLFAGAKDDPGVQSSIAAFRERLAMLGWIEGGNLRIDYRFAADPAAYAEELVNLRPDLILALTGFGARALQQRTAVIPIVFVGGGDAASTGLVGNIARPSGNMTGFAPNFASVGGKWLELFKEAIPGLTRVAHVVSAVSVNYNPRSEISTAMDAAAARLGVTIVRVPVHDTAEIEPAISAFAAASDGGLLLTGGGPRADLPLQQATKVELVINMKTAKALGITFPITLLGRADEVIE